MRTRLIRSMGIPLVVGLCFSFSQVSAKTPETRDAALIQALKETSEKRPDGLKNLIHTYCSTVLSDGGFSNKPFRYNAKYSAFVYLLCSNINPAHGAESELEKSYFKISSFKDLGFTDVSLRFTGGSVNFDNCNPGYMDNDCDLASNVPMLFNSIMEDYVNMKQSSIYGLLADYSSEADLSKIVNTKYSQPYFGVDICDNTKHPYDKTCRMVKSYMKNIKNIISEVRIFNNTSILADAQPKIELNKKVSGINIVLNPTPKMQTCTVQDEDYDVFICGLYGDVSNSMQAFVNLLYNEIYYYRLFIGYYMTMIQQYPEINADYNAIFQKFSAEYVRSKSAISLSLRMMRDMYMAFPFHVGLSMYQEDIDAFNRTLANIATPIYTLYDKLRNVQKPD